MNEGKSSTIFTNAERENMDILRKKLQKNIMLLLCLLRLEIIGI